MKTVKNNQGFKVGDYAECIDGCYKKEAQQYGKRVLIKDVTNRLSTITEGNTYLIVEIINRTSIKIMNDNGHKVRYSSNRFENKLKVRAAKLKKLKEKIYYKPIANFFNTWVDKMVNINGEVDEWVSIDGVGKFKGLSTETSHVTNNEIIVKIKFDDYKK